MYEGVAEYAGIPYRSPHIEVYEPPRNERTKIKNVQYNVKKIILVQLVYGDHLWATLIWSCCFFNYTGKKSVAPAIVGCNQVVFIEMWSLDAGGL